MAQLEEAKQGAGEISRGQIMMEVFDTYPVGPFKCSKMIKWFIMLGRSELTSSSMSISACFTVSPLKM